MYIVQGIFFKKKQSRMDIFTNHSVRKSDEFFYLISFTNNFIPYQTNEHERNRVDLMFPIKPTSNVIL